jgi:hypothetical protein
MKNRNFVFGALGLAAAISVGSADASAQARSQTRIPVRKDQPAEPAKVDTVIRVRVDTVTIRGRTDTVVRTVTGPTRYDTVMVQPPLQRLPGLYFGLGAGLAVPMNNWRNTTKDGPAIQGMVGWFPADGNIGIRVDALGNFFSNRDTDCPNCPKPKLYEANADLVWRFPLDRTSKLNPVLYVMGGGGVDKFDNFLPYRNTDNKIVTAGADTYLSYPGLTLVSTPSTAVNFRGDKSLFFNWNAGAGLDWRGFGLNWYVESKYTNVMTTNGTSHYWPITVGLKFW